MTAHRLASYRSCPTPAHHVHSLLPIFPSWLACSCVQGVEWMLWMDDDAIFTDMNFTMPFEQYDRDGINLVIWGDPQRVYRANDIQARASRSPFHVLLAGRACFLGCSRATGERWLAAHDDQSHLRFLSLISVTGSQHRGFLASQVRMVAPADGRRCCSCNAEHSKADRKQRTHC